MEDNTNKLNTAANLPEVPRKEDGTIDLEKITIGRDQKDRPIIPDNILEAYYKELPDGTTNESNNKWVYHGGILNKATPDVQKAGGEALQAKYQQRRTFAEAIEEMLRQPANNEMREDLNLKAGATNLDVVIAAALKQSARGNVKAMDFMRDTIGQKPSDKIDASVTALTPEDREMLERVQNRLNNT